LRGSLYDNRRSTEGLWGEDHQHGGFSYVRMARPTLTRVGERGQRKVLGELFQLRVEFFELRPWEREIMPPGSEGAKVQPLAMVLAIEAEKGKKANI
jgi:hypothetical protein